MFCGVGPRNVKFSTFMERNSCSMQWSIETSPVLLFIPWHFKENVTNMLTAFCSEQRSFPTRLKYPKRYPTSRRTPKLGFFKKNLHFFQHLFFKTMVSTMKPCLKRYTMFHRTVGVLVFYHILLLLHPHYPTWTSHYASSTSIVY